jgi:DNA invertase Pin-like site-specific DNA recombinase
MNITISLIAKFGNNIRGIKMKNRVAIYARVSTHDQKTLPMQIEKCSGFAFSRGWEVTMNVNEVGSGALKRPEREALLNLCRRRELDIVIVWKLDRWGRSVSDIVSTLQELQELGIQFVSVTEALDFTTAMGRAMGNLLAVFSEFEREMISERVKAGLAQAKLRGVKLGRPNSIGDKKEDILSLWKQHRNKSFIASKLGVSRRSVARIIESSVDE